MKQFILILFISSITFAQFTSNDSDLIYKTFIRNYDDVVFTQYIESGNPQNIVAALLSVSHSEDTSFVKQITKLNYDAYGKYISFALGQLGTCRASSNFLIDKIESDNTNSIRQALIALGKIGNKSSLNYLLELYFNDKSNFDGISLSILQFFMRDIRLEDGTKINEFILSEMNSKNFRRQFEALFLLSRFGEPENFIPQLMTKFNLPDNEKTLPVKTSALACLRSANSFPNDYFLFSKLIRNPYWQIRTEAARTLCFYNFSAEQELDEYFSLLVDENPNVSRQAAVSVRNVKLKAQLKNLIRNKLLNYLDNNNLTENAKGELFISYCTLFPETKFKLLTDYKKLIPAKYFFRLLSNEDEKSDEAYSYLTGAHPTTSDLDKLDLIPALLIYQNEYFSDPGFQTIIFNELNSQFPPAISIAADGLDSTFIAENSDQLRKICLKQTNKYLQDYDYLESLQSLERLSGKISEEYREEILKIMVTSKISSIRNYAGTQLGAVNLVTPRPDELFNNIIENAFVYTKAKVKTSKGEFTFELYPQFAPATVGNFCALVKQDYFDNVIFHRVVPDFVIQTGDPGGTGWGSPGYDIISETSLLPYDINYVGMASAGKDTEGSQWFVMHNNYPHLGGRYSNFGKVIEGMEVIGNVDQGDKVIDIELIK